MQGIVQFEILRRDAVSQRNVKHDSALAIDSFHDGTRLLPEIKAWIHYLSDCMRSSDMITGRVLQSVMHDMLSENPHDRITSHNLVKILKNLTESVQTRLGTKLGPRSEDSSVLKALHTFDELYASGPQRPSSKVRSSRIVSVMAPRMPSKPSNAQNSSPHFYSEAPSALLSPPPRLDTPPDWNSYPSSIAAADSTSNQSQPSTSSPGYALENLDIDIFRIRRHLDTRFPRFHGSIGSHTERPMSSLADKYLERHIQDRDMVSEFSFTISTSLPWCRYSLSITVQACENIRT